MWYELGEGGLWEKIFVSHLGWVQKAKADCNRFPATGSGMRLGYGSQDRCGSTFILLGRSSPWVSSRCLLRLGSGIKQHAGRNVRKGKNCGVYRRW